MACCRAAPWHNTPIHYCRSRSSPGDYASVLWMRRCVTPFSAQHSLYRVSLPLPPYLWQSTSRLPRTHLHRAYHYLLPARLPHCCLPQTLSPHFVLLHYTARRSRLERFFCFLFALLRCVTERRWLLSVSASNACRISCASTCARGFSHYARGRACRTAAPERAVATHCCMNVRCRASIYAPYALGSSEDFLFFACLCIILLATIKLSVMPLLPFLSSLAGIPALHLRSRIPAFHRILLCTLFSPHFDAFSFSLRCFI